MISTLKGNFRPETILIHDTLRLKYPHSIEFSAPFKNEKAAIGCDKLQKVAVNKIDTSVKAIRICACHSRADQQPLYFINGFSMEGSQLELLNPADIKSIDVMKDEEAAKIYGSRAANGVVLIYTRKKLNKKSKAYKAIVSDKIWT